MAMVAQMDSILHTAGGRYRVIRDSAGRYVVQDRQCRPVRLFRTLDEATGYADRRAGIEERTRLYGL